MKISGNYRVFVLFIVILFFGTCFFPPSISDNINQNYRSSILIEEGQILFFHHKSTQPSTSSLVDDHHWLMEFDSRGLSLLFVYRRINGSNSCKYFHAPALGFNFLNMSQAVGQCSRLMGAGRGSHPGLLLSTCCC